MAGLRGSFPHPVLDSSDDVSSRFEVFNFTYTPSVEDVALRFQVRMDDPTLKNLVVAGRVRYSLRWSCSATLSGGEVEPSVEKSYADSVGYVAWLDQRAVRGKVRVEVKLIAQEHITGYCLEHQHLDYGSASFDIEPGDILGQGGVTEIHPEKLYDPLNPPLGSCFTFEQDDSLKRGVRVHFDDDEHVLVRFPTAVFAGLQATSHLPELQISLVVLPALMETIAFIAQQGDPTKGGEDLSDRLWYQSLEILVNRVGASFTDRPLEVAQKILEYPTDKAIVSAAEGVDIDDD